MDRMSATSPSPDRQNPVLDAWAGEFEMPPFDAIPAEHVRPAFDRALAEHRAEIDTIAQSRAEPSFENTIAALEKGGRELERVAKVFFILAGGDTAGSPVFSVSGRARTVRTTWGREGGPCPLSPPAITMRSTSILRSTPA